MEKSLVQFQHIERISRQTRHHRISLNRAQDQKLSTELNELANEREQIISRSRTRRQLEQDRKQLLNVTVKQLVRERQHQLPPPSKNKQVEQATIQTLAKHDGEYEKR